MKRYFGLLFVAAFLFACGSEPIKENPMDDLSVEAAKKKIEEAKETIKKETKALEDAIKELDEAFEENQQ